HGNALTHEGHEVVVGGHDRIGFRSEPAGRDGVAGDAVGAVFDRHAAHQAGEAVLGGGVDAVIGHGDVAADRGDGNQPAMTVALHERGSVARQADGGGKVGANQVVDRVVVHVCERPPVARADIVDEDVEPSVPALDIGKRGALGGPVGDIEDRCGGA